MPVIIRANKVAGPLFQSQGKFEYYTKWLVTGAPGDGYIVQHIEWQDKVRKPNATKFNSTKNDYWEIWAWDNSAGSTKALKMAGEGKWYDDVWNFPRRAKEYGAGAWWMSGEAYWLGADNYRAPDWQANAGYEGAGELRIRHSRPNGLVMASCFKRFIAATWYTDKHWMTHSAGI